MYKSNVHFFEKYCDFPKKIYLCTHISGEMAEWSIAAVLKTVVPRGTRGSNPFLSAERLRQRQPKARQALQINDLWGFFITRQRHFEDKKRP